MPSHQSRRRSRRQLDDEDDEDSTRYGTRSPSQEPTGPKRRRQQVLDDEDDDSSSGEGERATNRARAQPNGNAPSGRDFEEDGFKPGAIRRVKVENFVTYEKAEFFPGPNLNMVIGPNGTGKSSLVCAICLGLGYSPKHLGRAASVKEFVKHNKNTASIEIELQRRRKDKQNPVVRVQIDRERNSQKWWLNDRETTHKAVQSLMKDLRIQVDNLCQFLPQDRVVEFAGCTPVDLLHETLRAAAPPHMLACQKELQELHREHKELEQQSGSHADQLTNLEGRQQAMRADVERLRERAEVQARVADLKDARVLAAYREMRVRYSEIKDSHKEAQQRLKRLEEDSAPSLEAVNKKQDYRDAVASVARSRQALVRNAEQKADRALAAVEDAHEHVTQVQAEMDAEQKAVDAMKKEKMVANTRVHQLETRLKKKPADFDPKEFNQKIRAQEHDLRELDTDHRGISSKLAEVNQEGKKVRDRRDRLQQELAALDTQEGQQLKYLEKNHPDVASGWKWLQDNRDRFEQEVFGPPLITCNVKDRRYSDHIQALLNQDDFLCFTTQTQQDHKALSDQLFGVMGLSVSIRTCLRPFSSFTKLPDQEMSAIGFDGTAIDFLSGPEPVLAMLCGEKKLNVSGISLKDISTTQYDQLIEADKVQTWVTGRRFSRVTRRRELGPGAVSTMTREIRPGQWWKDEVDGSEKQETQRQLNECNHEFAELKTQRDKLREEETELTSRRESIQQVVDDLKEQKRVLQKEFNEYQALPVKLENEKRSQANKHEALNTSRNKVVDLDMKLDKALVQKAKVVLKHHESIADINRAHQALIEAQIREIEAESDFSGLRDRNHVLMERLEEEKKKIVELERKKEQLRSEATNAQQDVRDVCKNDTERKNFLVELAGEKALAEMEEEIQAEEAKLELIHAANPNALREFEKRAQEIERLRQKVDKAREKGSGIMHKIVKLRADWEPMLEGIVSRINEAFSYNFEQISCAGEIRIHKDDDFDQWALDIMVKFRENETLQQLDQHRQSGGERAVSTIFYLMALQSMAQSPFRVVDEINQGMDPRNERMVHERMVEIACREHTSQYFLITPKLLTGLRYDKRMRVLCIASGEHMPTEGKKLDFKRCLQVHKRSVAATA